MRNLTCIVCPIGCSIDVEDDPAAQDGLSVTGNNCPRGAVYAREEVRAPKRVVTATCGIEGNAGAVRRVPVKTSSPCPRENISALLGDIYKATVSLPVKSGDVVIAGWKGSQIDVVATRTIANNL
jgi:CxxC motif-containing protein